MRLFFIFLVFIFSNSYSQKTASVRLFTDSSFREVIPNYKIKCIYPMSNDNIIFDSNNTKETKILINLHEESIYKLIIENKISIPLIIQPADSIIINLQKRENKIEITKIRNSSNTNSYIDWDTVWANRVKTIGKVFTDLKAKKISYNIYKNIVNESFFYLSNKLSNIQNPVIAMNGFITLLYLEPEDKQVLSRVNYEFLLMQLDIKFPNNKHINNARSSFNTRFPIKAVYQH